MRGQLSVEFMIVFTGLLVVVATVTLPIYNRSRADAEKLTNLAEAREAANTIANALNSIYASGPGSRLKIEYWLPKGTIGVQIGGYEDLEVDGIRATDGWVAADGRADVQIKLDLNNDGTWDNKREAVVLVDTILPSRWQDNGLERESDWVRENCVHVGEDNLMIGPAYGTLSGRTLHRTALTYRYDPGYTYPRRILIEDEITEGG